MTGIVTERASAPARAGRSRCRSGQATGGGRTEKFGVTDGMLAAEFGGRSGRLGWLGAGLGPVAGGWLGMDGPAVSVSTRKVCVGSGA